MAPLLLGLLAGAVVVFLLTPSPNRAPSGHDSDALGASQPVAPAALPASAPEHLPPPVAADASGLESLPRSARPATVDEPRVAARAASVPDQRASSRRAPGSAPAPTLILQAVSERDSYPIAIISDQLVKEGDLIGRVRVLKIGSDSVDVLLENGKTETVRFAPPPPPEPTPSVGSR